MAGRWVDGMLNLQLCKTILGKMNLFDLARNEYPLTISMNEKLFTLTGTIMT